MKTKTILTACCLFLNATASFSQSNMNFESWQGMPVGWDADDDMLQTSDAFAGNYAVSITPYCACGCSAGMLVNGNLTSDLRYGFADLTGAGTPCSAKATSMRGYYKLTSDQPDHLASAEVILKRFNTVSGKTDTVGYGISQLPVANGYAAFEVNITDMDPTQMPDSIVVLFRVYSKSFTNAHLPSCSGGGPVFFIDELFIPGITGVRIPNENSSAVIYPNPFTERAVITLPENYCTGDLTLYDTQGNRVKQTQIAGNKVDVSREGLGNGIYLFVVSSKEGIVSKGKLTIE